MKLSNFEGEKSQSLALPIHLLNFKHVASFRNYSALNLLQSKTETKFRTFPPFPSVKIVAEISESMFKVKPRTQLFIYFRAKPLCGLEESAHFPCQFYGENFVGQNSQRWETTYVKFRGIST